MDTGKSFSFPFEDRDWATKLGLGGVISLIPILNFAWSGYLVEIIRNVVGHNPEPLPSWNDIGRKFNDGLILFGAGIIYALPFLIGLCLPLSLIIVSGVFSENSDLQAITERMVATGGVLFFCLLGVLIVYGLILSIFYPVILVLFAREGTFASCFKLREALNLIRQNPSAFLTAWGWGWVASIAAGLILGFVNLVFSWIPCIGWVIGMLLSVVSGAYITAVYAHLFGQFGRIALESQQAVRAAE